MVSWLAPVAKPEPRCFSRPHFEKKQPQANYRKQLVVLTEPQLFSLPYLYLFTATVKWPNGEKAMKRNAKTKASPTLNLEWGTSLLFNCSLSRTNSYDPRDARDLLTNY